MKLIITQKLKDEMASWVDLNDIKEFAQKNPHLVQAEENTFAVTGVVIVPMRNNFNLILFNFNLKGVIYMLELCSQKITYKNTDEF